MKLIGRRSRAPYFTPLATSTAGLRARTGEGLRWATRQRGGVDRDTVGLLVASTLAGLAVLLALVALARQPFLLVVAVPFGVGAYLVWRGATGRFGFGLTGGRRVRETRFREAAREQAAGSRTAGGQSGQRGRAAAAGQRAADQRQDSRQRRQRRRRRTAGTRADQSPQPLGRREAYRVLGLPPDADAASVKAAYREQVKRTHPDADGGDREAFQRVNAAYETLRE